MNKTVTLIAAGITLISSSVSVADDAAGFPAPPAFAEVDSNGDLQISREEFDAAMEQRMAASASQGKLRLLGGRFLHPGSPGDNGPAFGAPPTFADFDSNGDLMITEDEFNAFSEQRPSMHKVRCRCIDDGQSPFDRMDADEDGMLSQQEYEAMMEKVRLLRSGD
jgi:Ca2+-binding EF-hand superfamily protein